MKFPEELRHSMWKFWRLIEKVEFLGMIKKKLRGISMVVGF